MLTHLDLRACAYLLTFLVATAAPLVATSQDATQRGSPIPLIQMERVPLRDAIKNLARQTGQNFIMDPKLESWAGAGREPLVDVRWENLSADQALNRLLKEHGLTMVPNPATSIARIVTTNQVVKPVPPSAVGAGTNAPIPLIVMDSVPLPDAIRNVANQARLRLTEDPSSPISSKYEVSVRWERVTARQALAALLDNYDLMLVEDSATSSGRIVAKPQRQAGNPSKEK